MDRARHQILAGAGFARDQDRAVRLRDRLHHAEDVEHRLAASDDVRELVARVERLLEQDVLLLQLRRLEVLSDLQPQFVHAERLGEVVHGAETHRFDRRARRCVGRHHERDDVAVDLLGGAQHVHARDVGHLDVGEQQIEVRAAQLLDGVAAVFRHEHLVAIAPQHDAQHLAHRRLIVDDQDADFARRGRCGARVRWSGTGMGRRHAHTIAPSPAVTTDDRDDAGSGERIGSLTRTVVPVPTVDDT